MLVCTPGMHGDSLSWTQEPTNLGRPCRHQLQRQDGNGASRMFPHLHCENKGNKSQQHSVLQTPVHKEPTGHTQDTCHKGCVWTHQCIKRVGLTWWQNGRGIRKFQRVVHKNNDGKSSDGKGKRARKQPLNPPQCPPSCPTSKGGQQTT